MNNFYIVFYLNHYDRINAFKSNTSYSTLNQAEEIANLIFYALYEDCHNISYKIINELEVHGAERDGKW